jgi:integrase
VEHLGRVRQRTQHGRITYFLDFRPFGRVWSHRGVPIPDGRTAEKVLSKIRARVAEGRDLEAVLADFSGSDAAPSRILVWLDKWLDHKRNQAATGQLSPTYLASLESYARPNSHFSWWQGRVLSDIKRATLHDWLDWMLRERLDAKSGKQFRLSAKSAQNVLGVFRSFVSWLVDDRELLPRTPKFPTVAVDEHRPTILSPTQLATVLGAIPEERRGIFLAAAHCLRPGEARALDARDYTVGDDGIGRLTISKAVKGKTAASPIRGTKTRRSRVIAVSLELQAWLDRFAPQSAEDKLRGVPLFQNAGAVNPDKRWTDGALHKAWSKACKATGISAHMYEGTKHTAATHLYRSGRVDERQLMAVTGHREARSVRRYAQLGDDATVAAFRPRP